MTTLGEELISNERVALTELVKNAYDADASLVVIRFRAPLAIGDGSIEVWDDGHGMSPETVQGTWLEIATPYRHRSSRSEGRGRRVLGAKGIGRFSAARLAQTTEVTTRRLTENEASVRVDWANFTGNDAYLDQVPVSCSSGTPQIFSGKGEAESLFSEVTRAFSNSNTNKALGFHGTVVRMKNLQQEWDDESVTALKNSLSRLLPPSPPKDLDVPDQPDFAIYLEMPGDKLAHHTGFVGQSETLAHPHYRLTGTINDSGDARIELRAGHGDSQKTEHITDNVSSSPSASTCGPLTIDIRAWDLDSESLRNLLKIDVGARNSNEVRKLIKGSSGIALYRDGFRVQPFGEAGFDWLELNLRRVNNPTMRLSDNQVAGFVYISADSNPGLRDRSHREGLIDSAEYDELKSRLKAVIAKLETLRYNLRRSETSAAGIHNPLTPNRSSERSGLFDEITENIEAVNKVAKERYPGDIALARTVDQASYAINEGVRKVQEVLSQFQRLATLGTLVDVVLHDGRTALANINFKLYELNRHISTAAKADTGLSDSLKKVQTGIKAQERALDRLFTKIQPLSGRTRGRPRTVSLHEEIKAAVEVHEQSLKKNGITIKVGGEDQKTTVSPGDLNTVVLNLVGNSIYWLSTMPENRDRMILIETFRVKSGDVEIRFSDSGPGVREEIRDAIFDTYFTDKPDGIGLGLSIAGSVLKDFYDGELSLVSNGPLPGACFKAVLRRRVG